jgi:predicted NAD/FAD-binding protein
MSIIKLNNQGVKDATAFGSISSLGSMTFIKKLTASSSATLSFVDGASSVVLDNTYKEYVFTFKDIHPASENPFFSFNLSVDGGSNYNVTKTSSAFFTQQGESGSGAELNYSTARDLAQSTGVQNISSEAGNDSDQTVSGYLHLFNPSSTTFVKHYISQTNSNFKYSEPYFMSTNVAGYGNTTSAVDAIQFSFSSGNIDSGDICLYGIA